MTVALSGAAIERTARKPVSDKTTSALVRFLLPSVTDILFLSLLCATYLFLGQHLLSDSDIGWHIRNGENILATRSVPHTDYFSYTMAGRSWYAWEWLYDAIAAAIHHFAGLDGIVLFSAIIFALTFALLFRFSLRRARALPIVLGLTLLSAIASSIHLLARPHIVTWLLMLIWYQQLDSFQRGESKRLVWLPVIMVVWVNLHGGFLVGLALIALFLAGNSWTAMTCSSAPRRALASRKIRRLVITLLASLVATFCTPYGYHLHGHVYRYLTNRFLMDSISEFLSPDFHLLQVKAFALLILITLAALAIGRMRRAIDLLVIAFSIWMGLYATRNIPLATILLTLTISPMLGRALRGAGTQSTLALWGRLLATRVGDYSARMTTVEGRLRGHFLPAIAVLLIAFAVTSRSSASTPGSITFNETEVPVKAVDFMLQHGIRDHFFSPDNWGGYLIYRMHPNVRLMVDDRHDFYGEVFMRDYLTVLEAGPEWAHVLDANRVQWVLAPSKSPLSSVIKSTTSWRTLYEDKTAVISERIAPPAPENHRSVR